MRGQGSTGLLSLSSNAARDFLATKSEDPVLVLGLPGPLEHFVPLTFLWETSPFFVVSCPSLLSDRALPLGFILKTGLRLEVVVAQFMPFPSGDQARTGPEGPETHCVHSAVCSDTELETTEQRMTGKVGGKWGDAV